MTMEGGGVEVGGVSFRIGVDLSSFERDLQRAEELARSRVARMQQSFDSLRMGSARPGGQSAAGQLELPDMSRGAQRFQQRLASVQAAQQSAGAQQEMSVSPGQAPPPPGAPANVEHIRRVNTRNYHTTDQGGGPEPVHPPTPVKQQRTIATQDVRSSTAPQELPPPLPPTPVKQTRVVALPAPPPQPPMPLTPVQTAWGQDIHIPSYVSDPNKTQRQIPSRVSGIPSAQRPLVHIPPSSSALPSVGSASTPPPAATAPPQSGGGDIAGAAASLRSAAQQVEAAATSLKGQLVQWTGAAGAVLSGKVTSEKGDTARVNVGGATHTVDRSRLQPMYPTGGTQVGGEEQVPLLTAEPKPAATPRVRGVRFGPEPVRPVFSVPTKVSDTPPALPRFGQEPRVHFEPQEGGATTQAAYVLAPQGIYQTETPVGVRRSVAQQAALGSYASGEAQKVQATQFPPYARFLEQQRQLQAEYEADPTSRGTRAPTQVPGAAPAAPRIRAPRQYDYESGRRAIRLTTGSTGATLERAGRDEEGKLERYVGGPPLTRSEAARELVEARRRARVPNSDASRRYTSPEITPLHAGGQAHPDRLQLVGEHGSELFVPKAAGYVLAHNQARDAVAEGIRRAGGGMLDLFGGEQPKQQLPAFGTVLKKSRRRAQQPTGFDASQPDLFGGAGIERGEGTTRAQQLGFARQEMFDFGAPSLFEAPVVEQPAPEPEAAHEQPAEPPKVSRGVPGWKPSASDTAERVGKIAKLSSIRKRAAGGPTPADKLSIPVARDITTAHLEQFGLRPAHEIGAKLGPAPFALPAYMRPMQQFITQQSERLAAGKLTPAEVSSAYLITLSSIRGGERNRPLAETSGAFPQSVVGLTAGKETIRPEDAFANWLSGPNGQHIQQLIVSGRVDEAQQLLYSGARERFRGSGFGFPQLNPRKKGQLDTAAAFEPGRSDVINLRNIQAATEQLNRAGRAGASIEPIAEQFAGVGVGKTGFLSQFLVSGKYPTLDINALQTWFGSERLGGTAQRAMGSTSSDIGWRIRQHVTSRQYEMQQMGYLHDVPGEQLPALMHHALFDAAKRSQTSHQAIIDSITEAGHRQEGGTVDVTDKITPLTRGQKAAATRAARRAMGLYKRAQVSNENPFLAHTKPGPGLVKLTDEEIIERNDELFEQRMRLEEDIASAESRLEGEYYSPEESIGGVQRPPWATGISSAALLKIAKAHGVNATKPNWWGRAGLYEASDIEGIASFTGSDLDKARGTATDARRELEQQRAALKHIEDAMAHIGSGGALYKPVEAKSVSDLPFGPTAGQRLRVSIDAGGTTAGLATTFALPSLGALRGDIAARTARGEPFYGTAPSQRLALPAGAPSVSYPSLTLPGAPTAQLVIPSRTGSQPALAALISELRARSAAPSRTPRLAAATQQPIAPIVSPRIDESPTAAFERQQREAIARHEAFLASQANQGDDAIRAEYQKAAEERAARRAAHAVAPAQQLDPLQQAHLSAIDLQIQRFGSSGQPAIARHVGHLHLLRTLVARGTPTEDIPALLRTMQVSHDEIAGLQEILQAGSESEFPELSPAEAGHVTGEFEKFQQEIIAKYGGLPIQPAPPRRATESARGPALDEVRQKAQENAILSKYALSYLQSREASTIAHAGRVSDKAFAKLQLSPVERRARAFLQSGSSLDQLVGHLQLAGTSKADAEALVAELRAQVAPVTPDAAPTVARGPSLLSRLRQRLAAPGEARAAERVAIRRRLGLPDHPETEQERIHRRLGIGREYGGDVSAASYVVGEAGTEIAVSGVTGYGSAKEQVKRAIAGGTFGKHERVVGVSGPEGFTPKEAGYVLSHAQSRQAVAEAVHRQAGGPVTEQDVIAYLQGLPQRAPHEHVAMQLLQSGQASLGDLANQQLPGLANQTQVRQFVQDLQHQAHPTLGPAGRAVESQLGATATAQQAAVSGPAPGLAPAQQQAAQRQLTNEFRQQFQELQNLTAQYLRAAGASEQYAQASSRGIATQRLVQQRTDELSDSFTRLTGDRTAGERRAREEASREVKGLLPEEDGKGAPRGAGGLGDRLFGQSGNQLIREVGAIAGVNLGFNVMTGLARQVHDLIADTVDETTQLANTTARVGVAFGGAGRQFGVQGFAQFQNAPLVAQTQSSYQQTAASLAPLTSQYQITNDQVQQLTTSSAQLATIWGVTQPQAAQVLEQVIRGNVQVGQQLNLNLVDQYGRIQGLGVSYQELASVIGPAAASQRVFAEAQQAVNQQVSEFQALAPQEAQQLVQLSQAQAQFKASLATAATGPVTSVLTDTTDLLNQINSITGANRPARAMGGDAGSGSAYLVGERGPELFVPGQAGHVYSHGDTVHILGARQEGGPVERLQELASTPAGKALLGLAAAPILPIATPLAGGTAAIAGLASNPLGRVALGVGIGAGAAGALGGGALAIGAGAVVGGALGVVAPGATSGARQIAGNAAASVIQGDAQLHKQEADQLQNFSKFLGDSAQSLPGPLAAAAFAAAAFADTAAAKAREVAAQEPGQALNVRTAISGQVDTTGANLNLPDDQAARNRVAQSARDSGAAARQAQITAATTAQSRANQYQQEASARIAQSQAEQALRLYDVNQSNLTVDGQRVSAADALNKIRLAQLPVEQQLQATQLRSQQVQDQITVGLQQNLSLRQKALEAQRTQVGTGAAVTQLGFEQRRDVLQAQLAVTGQAPGVNVGQLIGNMFQRAFFQQPRAELADVNAQIAANTANAAESTSQLTKQINVIPQQGEQQQLERATLMYQEQDAALQAQGDTINRMLEFANIVAAPSVLAAQAALAKAQLDAANAWEQIIVPTLNQIPGVNLQSQTNTGAVARTQSQLGVPTTASTGQPVVNVGTQGSDTTSLQVTIAPARAAGGPAGMHGAYMVGERGPELFVPSQSGYVYSNKQTMAMLGARADGGPVGGLGIWDAGGAGTIGGSGVSVNLHFGDVTIGQQGVDMDSFSRQVMEAAIAGTLQVLHQSSGNSNPRVSRRVAGAR